jgi:hypothetical protein
MCLFVATVEVSAQQGMVVLSSRTVTLSELFSEIERQTGSAVMFDADTALDRQVTLPAMQGSVKELLDAALPLAGYTRQVIDRYILVRPAEKTAPSTAAVIPSDGYRRNDPADFGDSSRRRSQRPVRTIPVDTVYTTVRVERPVDAVRPPMSNKRSVTEYAANQGRLPRFALKTNLLYAGATATPNLAFEFGLGRRTSLELSASYNPWNLSGSLESNKKLVHMIIKPEFRWWTCERFNGHFFGLHGIYAHYNVGTRDIPLLFDKEYRYEGWAAGGGISYGYHWSVARRWSVEFGLGVGALYMKYDRYDCAACSRDAKPYSKTYFGPTDASISLIFLIK